MPVLTALFNAHRAGLITLAEYELRVDSYYAGLANLREAQGLSRVQS